MLQVKFILALMVYVLCSANSVYFLACHSPERLSKTVDIETSTVEIEERGVKLKLTVVDTPGFGDSLDNSKWYENN